MKKTTLLLSVLLFSTIAFSQQFRVACIGNSITAGATPTLNYPFLMQYLLPSEYYSIANLGVSGKTLIFGGNAWINETIQTDSMKSFQPNIVTIKLGTNDCNSSLDENVFKADYLKLIDSVYSWSTPDVKIYLCLPIVMFPPSTGNTYMTSIVIPKIQEVATETGLPIIDLNTPFIGHPEYCVSDGIHPSTEGFNLIADLIYEGIRVNITSITINTVGSVPAEITSEGGMLVFEASFEPVYASHSDIVWSMEKITGDAIMGGRTIQAVSNGTIKVIATSPEGGPVVTDEIIVTISGQPEVTNIIENSGYIFYPNPTKDVLNLDHISDFESATIYDLQSKKVMQIDQYSNKIDVSALPNNIYIICIKNGVNEIKYTFVKE